MSEKKKNRIIIVVLDWKNKPQLEVNYLVEEVQFV